MKIAIIFTSSYNVSDILLALYIHDHLIIFDQHELGIILPI